MTHEQLNEIIALKERAKRLEKHLNTLRGSNDNLSKFSAIKDSEIWPDIIKSADALMESEIKTAEDRIEFLMNL